jgi:cation:H+ antiporter
MQIFGSLLALLFFVFILIKSADLTIEALKSLAKRLGAGTFAISAIILAMATSLPELFVGITAAIEGAPSLSLGNVLGANIANLSLVAGLAGLISGGVFIHEKVVTKEILLAIGAAVLPIFLLLDGTLSRVDGLILLSVYFAYTTSFFKPRFLEIGKYTLGGRYILRFVRHLGEVEQKADKTLGHLFVGIAALLFSANFIVEFATDFARASGISVFVIGVILISLGTTLPEVIVSIESLKKSQPGVFFGNILGSLIVNSTLILGVVSVISPIQDGNLGDYLIALVTLGITLLLFWLFTRTKNRLERWEALTLLMVYAIFAAVEFF